MRSVGATQKQRTQRQHDMDPELDRHDLAEAVAEQLLNRWGVLFRELAVHDGVLRLPWREIQWALRRLEDRGLVRGGRFVSRFQRRTVRPARGRRAARAGSPVPRTQERVVVNATDPSIWWADRARRDRSGRADQPGGVRRRPARNLKVIRGAGLCVAGP